jgi:hypothetical protein
MWPFDKFKEAMLSSSKDEFISKVRNKELLVDDPAYWEVRIDRAESMKEIFGLMKKAADEHKENGGGVVY